MDFNIKYCSVLHCTHKIDSSVDRSVIYVIKYQRDTETFRRAFLGVENVRSRVCSRSSLSLGVL
jgi:hypothetical protein